MTSTGKENLIGRSHFPPGDIQGSSLHASSPLPGSSNTQSSATDASALTLSGQLTALSILPTKQGLQLSEVKGVDPQVLQPEWCTAVHSWVTDLCRVMS